MLAFLSSKELFVLSPSSQQGGKYFAALPRICNKVLFCYSTLDEAAMKAIVALLKNLPLQPETVESDIVEAKSILFLK